MKRNVFTLGATIAVMLLCTTLVLAQSSANFTLAGAALTGGGGQHSSANFIVQDALGQTAIGTGASANLVIQAGFPASLTSEQTAITAPTATPLPPPSRR